MLTNLYIENLAVIERASIDFKKGLCVFTGETGAGKSIVIDAINAILGHRTSKDIIRSGAQKAVIIASFSDYSEHTAQKLIEFGIEPEEKIIVERQVSCDGKSSSRIMSRPVAVSALKELGSELINIHGQHDNQIIMSSENHIYLLDMFARLSEQREEYAALFTEYKTLCQKLSSFNDDESLKAQKIDLLSYQINEIESAELSVDEEQELNERHNAIKNFSKIAGCLSSAYEKLFGTDEFDGAAGLLSDASYDISTAGGYYPALSELGERVESLSIELSECSSEVRDILENLDFDEDEINRVESRLDEIYKLKIKYGQNVSQILEFCENAKKQLGEIEMSDEIKAELASQISKAENELNKRASQLSKSRLAAAQKFTRLVSEELKFLDMPNVSLEIRFTETPLNANGADKIEFLISTNPGELPKPVSKIASGGELSRIMLAIKSTLADKDNIPTLIFDEIDTGISGSGSQKIGLKLRQVSQNRQVICVTHSAQIAALADNHMKISKTVKNDRTFTEIAELDFDGRKNELARIIGTDTITELTLKNAEEMLKMAHGK